MPDYKKSYILKSSKCLKVYSLDIMHEKVRGRKKYYVQDIISKAKALKTCHYTVCI